MNNGTMVISANIPLDEVLTKIASLMHHLNRGNIQIYCYIITYEDFLWNKSEQSEFELQINKFFLYTFNIYSVYIY